MTLYDICVEIAGVEEKLAYGEIDVSYDNLMSAMKPGHPADILDDILSIIGWDVQMGEEPKREALEQTLEELKTFKKCFGIKQLNKAIKGLESYLKEGNENG